MQLFELLSFMLTISMVFASAHNNKPSSNANKTATNQRQSSHVKHPINITNDMSSERMIGHIMREIVHPEVYYKWIRPKSSGAAEKVGISINILSVDDVDLFNMDVTLDFYFRQYWMDERLSFFSYGYNQTLQPGHEFVGSIWRPDISIIEERRRDELNVHGCHLHDCFIRVQPDGAVTLSKRTTARLRCQMDIYLYPFDVHSCQMSIESYGHSTRDMMLYMYDQKNAQTGQWFNEEARLLSEYQVTPHASYETTATTSTGFSLPSYFCLFFDKRRMRLFSRCSALHPLWIRDTVSRLAFGVTTVLTMTTLQSETNSALPRVSYVRSIDIYLGTCFMLVFAALIECTLLGYLDRIARKNEENEAHTAAAQHENSDISNHSLPEAALDDISANQVKKRTLKTQTSLLKSDNDGCQTGRRLRGFFPQYPEGWIRLSRLLYPLVFTVFNIYYWVSIITGRQKLLNGSRPVPPT